jgi:PAS domain S-box-containing protein
VGRDGKLSRRRSRDKPRTAGAVSAEIVAGTTSERAREHLVQYFMRTPTPAYLWRKHGDDLVLETANHAGIAVTDGRVRDRLGIRAQDFYARRPDIVADLRRSLGGETFTRELKYEWGSPPELRDMVVTYVHIPPDAVAAHVEDVTVQRRIEAELRESHENARGILDASSQPIVLLEADGTVIAGNEALRQAFGLPYEEIVGRPIFDFFPPDNAAFRKAVIGEVVRKRTPVRVEDEDRGRHFRTRLYPMLDERGEVARVVVYTEDFTDELRARTELLRIRERHEEAQRTAHLGHWEWSVDSDDVSWSAEVFRIFGTTPEIFTATYEAVMERIHPADRARLEGAVQGALRHGAPYSEEVRVLRPDGTTRIVRAQGELRDGGSPGRRIVGTVLDITDLKAAEDAVRAREADLLALIEGNPDGICLTIESRIRVCNTAITRLLGRTRDQVLGLSMIDLLVPEERDRALARGREILDGADAEPAEYTGLRADGTRVPLEIYSAMTEFRGEPALISTIRDVSKRRQAERELEESHELQRALTSTTSWGACSPRSRSTSAQCAQGRRNAVGERPPRSRAWKACWTRPSSWAGASRHACGPEFWTTWGCQPPWNGWATTSSSGPASRARWRCLKPSPTSPSRSPPRCSGPSRRR